jgi:hypothetical protein
MQMIWENVNHSVHVLHATTQIFLCSYKLKMVLGQASEEKMQYLFPVLMEATALKLLTLKQVHAAKNLVVFLG